MNNHIAIPSCSEGRIAVVVVGPGGPIKGFLGEALDRLGCDMPSAELSQNLAAFNAEILNSAGCLPTQLTSFNHDWLNSPKAAEFLLKALKLIELGFDRSYLMVLDDWQSARLIGFWNRVFAKAGIEPKFVFAVPAADELGAVVTSASGLGTHAASLLGLRLFLEAEFSTRGQSRTFVTSRQASKGAARLGADLSQRLDLVWPRNPAKALKSMEYPVPEVVGEDRVALADHEWLTAAWSIAEKWAQSSEAEDDALVLEAVLEAFDEAAPAFVGVESIDAGSSAALTEMEEQLEAARKETAIVQARLRTAEVEHRQSEEAAVKQKAMLESRIAHLESALIQRKAEVDEGHSQLEEARKSHRLTLEQFMDEKRTLEQRVKELHGQVEEAQNSVAVISADSASSVRDLTDRIDTQRAELEAAAVEKQDRLAEIVKLSRMLAGETASANRAKMNIERLGRIATILGLVGGGRFARHVAWLMPRNWYARRALSRLSREGLFDAAAYLAANPDVGHAGVDPLVHYLRHGLVEGRPSGID